MRSIHGFIVIVGMFVALTLGGCSIPRAAYLCTIVHHEIPVPPGGQRIDWSIDTFLVSPGVKATITASMNQQDTLDWYQNALKDRGWSYKGSHTYSDAAKQSWQGHNFERSVGWVKWFGSLEPEIQRMRITLVSTEEDSCEVKLDVTCDNFYIWDVPTRVVGLFFEYSTGYSRTQWWIPLFAPF